VSDIVETTCDLTTLATAINDEHRACVQALRAGLAHAIRAGELLIEAKAAVAHGEWLPWLSSHFEGSERTAQAYMRVARGATELAEGNPQRVADFTYREALAALAPRAPVRPGAISPAELLDASEEEIARHYRAIDERLAELRHRLDASDIGLTEVLDI